MDSVARGVRFWQLVRLGVAGRAWASLLGVLGGDVGRARMACGRCERGRRCARRLTECRCSAALVIRWKARAAGVSREGGGLGEGSRGMQECGLRRSCCVASGNLCIWRYAGRANRWCLTRSGAWECEADGPSCGTFVLRMAVPEVRLIRPHMHGTSGLPGVHRSGRRAVVPSRSCVVWRRDMAQEVRLERPCFRSCSVGESGGWLGNNQKDGQELQVWFGHGKLSGSGSAFGNY